jgi:hypothetical protein
VSQKNGCAAPLTHTPRPRPRPAPTVVSGRLPERENLKATVMKERRRLELETQQMQEKEAEQVCVCVRARTRGSSTPSSPSRCRCCRRRLCPEPCTQCACRTLVTRCWLLLARA